MGHQELIKRAAEIVGSRAQLAREIGVKPPTVHQWVAGERPVPVKRCLAIERATGGAVTAREFYPEVFEEKAA